MIGIAAVLLAALASCKPNEQRSEAQKIVTEWMGKTIRIPDNVRSKVMGRDTVCPDLFEKPYKILVYIDSAGCTSCKLRMPDWKDIISEADAIAPGKIGFLFFFNPKDEKELDYLMKRDRFDYPVFMDTDNTIDRLNHFPRDMKFQSFLLDPNNTVLAIGNPSMNPLVWELYKQQITGEKTEQSALSTTALADQQLIKLSDMRIGSTDQALFTLRNTGNNPLVIQDIKSSCGCTVPSWDKEPVESGSSTAIRVEIKPEETGYFHKTIDVYCNTKEKVIQLAVQGMVQNKQE
jgi:Protein of unknown function (DUF1573).